VASDYFDLRLFRRGKQTFLTDQCRSDLYFG
jgi:hypothetical protein